MEPVRSAPLSVAAGSQSVILSGAGVPGSYKKMKLVAQGLALNLLMIGWAQASVEPVAVVGSARADLVTSQPLADFGGPAVVLTPLDGVSVSIPKQWIACDDPNNSKLSPAADTLSLAPKICTGPRSGGTMTFGAFDPEPLRTVAIYAGREPESPITEGMILRTPHSNFAALAANVCPFIEKPLVDAHATVKSCVLNRKAISGHSALVFNIVYTPPEGPVAQGELESWVIPSTHGIVDFNVVWPLIAKDKVTPMLEAVRNSLQVQ